jgi:hypothetical protein
MKELENLTINCDINDALYQMNEAEYGAHYIIIYPNLATIRQLYTSYIPKQIQENNEIVLLNPFYETTESTRQVLSQRNPDLDVSKHEKEKSLLIIDSLEGYFGKPSDGMPFKRNLANHAKKIGKNGLSILGDIGAYPYKSKSEDLVDYESSLPAKFDLPMKVCQVYRKTVCPRKSWKVNIDRIWLLDRVSAVNLTLLRSHVSPSTCALCYT